MLPIKDTPREYGFQHEVVCSDCGRELGWIYLDPEYEEWDLLCNDCAWGMVRRKGKREFDYD